MEPEESFNVYTNAFIKLLSKHPDWKLRTLESRFEKTGRLKFSYRKNPKGKEPIYGTVYVSKGGVLHYEVKTLLRIGRRIIKTRPIMQDRPLPTTYKEFMCTLKELNQMALILMNPAQFFRGSDGNSVFGLTPKLTMGNVN